jgi:hypothetical protein
MAVTTIAAQVMNPYVGASPKNIGTDFEQRLWANWCEKFERKETPVTNLIKRGKKPYNQVKIRTGQHYNPFLTTALNGVTANNSQNITVDSTSGLRVGDVLRITDYQSGSTVALDNSTVEYVRVESVTSGTVLVGTRDMDQTASGAWPVHADNSLVELVSRASPMNATFMNANVHRGDFVFNYAQMFESALETTIQAMHTPSEESDNYWEDDRANVVQDLKYFRERAFVEGIRMAGDEISVPVKPFTMGGIIWQIENNASANVNDLGNANLKIWDIDDQLREVEVRHRKGPAIKNVLIHPNSIPVWDGIITPHREATMSDTTFTTKTTTGHFRWGDITPVPTITVPEGVLIFIDPSDWEWNSYEGCDWHEVRQDPENIFKANEAWAMWGVFSIVCKDINRQMIVKNFQTDLTTYPFRSWGQ